MSKPKKQCADHARAFPCSQCTNRVASLLGKRVSGTNLWDCDVDALRTAANAFVDYSSCTVCGRGSTHYDPPERCTCKGGKTTLLHLAEQRCDSGAMWKGEDVVDSKGRTFKGDDPTWQRNCPFGASKESLQVVNLIKARTLH